MVSCLRFAVFWQANACILVGDEQIGIMTSSLIQPLFRRTLDHLPKEN